MTMELTSRTEDSVVVVDVTGSVNGTEDEETELTSMMREILSRGEKLFLVNLDNILSFDESGMRTLLRVCATVHSNGGFMVFVRSTAEGADERDSSPDDGRLVFESKRHAVAALKKRSNV